MTSTRWIIVIVAVVCVVGAYAAYSVFLRGPRVVLASGEELSGKDIAAPLTAELLARRSDRIVIFTYRLTDGAGRGIRAIRLGGGRSADLPRVSVVGEGGNVVHTGSFQYG